MFLFNTDWDGEITKLAINFDFLVKQFPHINHFCIKRSALVQAQSLLSNFDHRLKKQQLTVSGFLTFKTADQDRKYMYRRHSIYWEITIMYVYHILCLLYYLLALNSSLQINVLYLR